MNFIWENHSNIGPNGGMVPMVVMRGLTRAGVESATSQKLQILLSIEMTSNIRVRMYLITVWNMKHLG